jgi:CDP-glycerol glycerophosphotransferase (TagB/SpsB family)
MSAKNEKKALGVNPQTQIHYIDHLAVVCILMGIPLLFLDDLDYTCGQKYYPGLKSIKLDYQEFSPEFLIQNYDVCFFSDLWDRQTFHEKFSILEKKYQKILRHVHVPHGFSDKAFYIQKCINEDIVLVYGQNMIDMLKETGVYEYLPYPVMSGNYRYAYFKEHRAFYDKIVQEEVLSKFDQKRPLILYAPTWLDVEESTTFFDSYQHILGTLPSSYNLIVKLHPRLELDDTGKYYHIVGKYEKKPNILFLKDFPLVYPLLAHTDIYLGDMSSVGYDFLPFNRPMFFLNKNQRNSKTDRGLFLFRCGVEVLPPHFKDLYTFMEKHLEGDGERLGKIRQEVYDYTFLPDRPFKEIRADIIKAYNSPYIE